MMCRVFTGLFLSVFSFFAMGSLGPVFDRPGYSVPDSTQVGDMRLIEDGTYKASHGFLLDEQNNVVCQVDLTNTPKEEQKVLVPDFVTPVSVGKDSRVSDIPVCSSEEKQELAVLASHSRSSLDNQYAGWFVPILAAGLGYITCRLEKDGDLRKAAGVGGLGVIASGGGGWAESLPNEKTLTKSDMLSKTAGKGLLRGLSYFGGGWLICEGVAYFIQE